MNERSPSELLRLRQRVRHALKEGRVADVARLRALQGELFVVALQTWRSKGQHSREMAELAGGFAARAARSGWLDENRLLLRDAELAVLFYMRWSKLANVLEHSELRPPNVVWRLYYRALLRLSALEMARSSAQIDQHVAYATALARHDENYPRDFALGVLLYRGHRYAEAASAFRRYLADPETRRWRLRARNHWLECRARQNEPGIP